MFFFQENFKKVESCLNQDISLKILSESQSVQNLMLAFLCNFLSNSKKISKIIVLTSDSKSSLKWFGFFQKILTSFDGGNLPVYLVPSMDLWGQEKYLNKSSVRSDRLCASFALAQRDKKCLVVSEVEAFFHKAISSYNITKKSIQLKVEQNIDLILLSEKLKEIGYCSCQYVLEKGAFSIRGGIIDIFPNNRSKPIRVSFIADRISSISEFDCSTQRSVKNLESEVVIPFLPIVYEDKKRTQQSQVLYEYLLKQNVDALTTHSILDAFRNGRSFLELDHLSPLLDPQMKSPFELSSENVLYFFPESYDYVKNSWDKFCKENLSKDNYKKNSFFLVDPVIHYSTFFDSTNFLNKKLFVEFGGLSHRKNIQTLKISSCIHAKFDQILLKAEGQKYNGFDFIEELLKDGLKIICLFSNQEFCSRLTKIFHNRGFDYVFDSVVFYEYERVFKIKSDIVCALGKIEGYFFDEQNSILIFDAALFWDEHLQSATKQKTFSDFKHIAEINLGDYVVYAKHGVAKYCGIKNLNMKNGLCDLIKLEYAGGDHIYVPVDKLSYLQKFSKENSESARLDKLGSKVWQAKKTKASQKVKDIAEKLLKIEAKRKVQPGVSISYTSKIFSDMVNDFPFKETEDQLRSISEVLEDLKAPFPMDRLLVGDVGFGKTEVAIRASMLTVLEGYEVLIIAPTTILSKQLFDKFKNRLEKYGVTLTLLNRFITPSLQVKIVEEINNGKIDIVVGTHSLLSKPIVSKKIGLVIIDEEHRFGVVHKEKLKQLAPKANLLTMTATPIPRTLNMASLGLKDMSMITTPPKGRLAVKSVFCYPHKNIVKDAIVYEINRGGQIFYVHNNIQDLFVIQKWIEECVPSVKIISIHGQMSSKIIEERVMDFLEQKYNLLLCTTIIESGVDMPNVNTIFINEAQNYGLAQLHQLRGRVGRGNSQAYAYFLSLNSEFFSDKAKKRLEGVMQTSALGGGFQLANTDMSIRGVGNLLGKEQSGVSNLVGYELYTEMLAQAVKSLQKGDEKVINYDIELQILANAKISKDFICDEAERLKIYRRLFGLCNINLLMDFRKNLEDRYGIFPQELANLFLIAELRVLLAKIGAKKLREVVVGEKFEIFFAPLSQKIIFRINEFVNRNTKHYSLNSQFNLQIHLTKNKNNSSYLEDLVASVESLKIDLEV